ncbi:putative sulfate exporter family transporter [Xanthomonas sp. GW]|uniref:YeiH family protein n=1 Tax=Xanthomonas sp. GW TaxID=2724121 RepID=UPI00163B52EB|nr:putative sulfate exporter family transporter [Xanthomonas sp. GW]QNH22064.1 putative sulfate exporter family transporter [Xanthomonas sp. GW]
MHKARNKGAALLPGLLLAIAVAALAWLTEQVQLRWLGRPWIDALVFAIALGTVLRTAVRLPARADAGIAFAAKLPLEVAIVLLGASVSFGAVGAAGGLLLGLIAATVLLAIGIGYGIGRLLGLPARLATLVACGNAICGNSAIVAAAPVIDADSDEVAASIAFTAALGIVVVLLLPLAVPLFGLDQRHYGILAGMTVYAVPQVLAATLPVGAISAQVGALVKLMRVVMLGPVMLLLGLTAGRPGAARLPLHRLLPWFVLGFVGMMLLRSSGLLPLALADAAQRVSALLTLVAMAALGLSVNLRSVLASGGRVLAAGTLSLLSLAAISGLMLYWLP